MPTFNKISVLGLGTMGTGIAQICAQTGSAVVAYDAFPDEVRQAPKRIERDLKRSIELSKVPLDNAEESLERIAFTTQLEDCADSELVIEAVTEKLDLKIQLFSQLDDKCPPPAIFATATSFLSVTTIAAKTRFPERVCGMHFMNPAAHNELVEIIATRLTDRSTLEAVRKYAGEIGKQTVLVKDSPGFLVHRLLNPYLGEALRCLGEGVADFSTIDEIFRTAGFEFGPFQRMDEIGLDAVHAMNRSIWDASYKDGRYRPHPLLKKMIEAGTLGKKSGRGFYEYPHE
ncbi:3-hydroxybutyryl-CoA dehydrogenase [bacterium]|nr:3-hydroxybutyryl-CoA dehydrogenase [bacterium]MBU1636248.1 3-hydroxybutyryl-CoA dehydrogenase [bacterium]